MTCADAAPRTPKALLMQHQAGHSATPFPRGSPWEPPPPSSVILQTTEVGEGGVVSRRKRPHRLTEGWGSFHRPTRLPP